MRAVVDRDDAGFVSGFHEQHDVTWALNDLVVAHVARPIAPAKTRHAPRQTAKRVSDIGWRRGLSKRGVGGRLSVPALWCDRRNASVLRIDDERRAIVELEVDHVGGAVSGVRVGVALGVGQHRLEHAITDGEVAVAGLEQALGASSELGDLFVGQMPFALECLRAARVAWRCERARRPEDQAGRRRCAVPSRASQCPRRTDALSTGRSGVARDMRTVMTHRPPRISGSVRSTMTREWHVRAWPITANWRGVLTQGEITDQA